MARIAHNTPIIAFDHVAAKLKESAGEDGIISREDAEKLITELKDSGNGTEALAARNIFKIIDAADSAKGARVTGADIDSAKTFVENQMAKTYDTNSNGYSMMEIRQMSSTGQSLVELGRILKAKRKPGRVGYDVPERGMAYIAELINKNGGPDNIISREDRDAMLEELYDQGRGNEALACGYFFNFIDKRDHELGARVTIKDIDKAVEYAGHSLLKNKDNNQNGYSKEEIENFSTTAKAFLRIGKMLEAGIIKD